MLRAHGVTDKGRVRSTNEDAFVIDLELGLCVVADGMGGHKAGEVASQLAVKTTVDWLRGASAGDQWPYGFDSACSPAGNRLKTAVHMANRAVFDLAASSADYEGMGTTIVAFMVHDRQLSVAHAGDSRLYLFSAGQLRQLTEDDSWIAQVLARDPLADSDTLRRHPMRHALTNVVGARAQMVVTLQEHSLKGLERLLLTTDGIHGVLEESYLQEVVGGHEAVDQMATHLVASALESGSRDNCTAVVAEFVPETST